MRQHSPTQLQSQHTMQAEESSGILQWHPHLSSALRKATSYQRAHYVRSLNTSTRRSMMAGSRRLTCAALQGSRARHCPPRRLG